MALPLDILLFPVKYIGYGGTLAGWVVGAIIGAYYLLRDEEHAKHIHHTHEE